MISHPDDDALWWSPNCGTNEMLGDDFQVYLALWAWFLCCFEDFSLFRSLSHSASDCSRESRNPDGGCNGVPLEFPPLAFSVPSTLYTVSLLDVVLQRGAIEDFISVVYSVF